jgi:hypothetical protein
MGVKPPPAPALEHWPSEIRGFVAGLAREVAPPHAGSPFCTDILELATANHLFERRVRVTTFALGFV